MKVNMVLFSCRQSQFGELKDTGYHTTQVFDLTADISRPGSILIQRHGGLDRLTPSMNVESVAEWPGVFR